MDNEVGPEEGEVVEGKCVGCFNHCPKSLTDSRGFCVACQKKFRRCKGHGCKNFAPENADWCKECDKGRNAKWVTKDSMDNCIAQLRNDQDASLRLFENKTSAMLNSFATQLFQTFSQQLPTSAAEGQSAPSMVCPNTGSAAADMTNHPSFINTDSAAAVTMETKRRNHPVSAAAGSAASSQESSSKPVSAAAGRTKQTDQDTQASEVSPSEFNFHVGRDDHNDGASLAQTTVTSMTKSCISTQSASVPVKRSKEGFIADIMHLNDPFRSKPVETLPSDGMQKLFNNCKVFSDKEEETGMPLADIQKKFLTENLQPGKEAGKAVHASDLKCLPVAEKDKMFFVTPKVNKVIKEYLSVLNASKQEKGKGKDILPRNSTAGNADNTLEKIDVAAKAGLRYSVYQQWLFTSIKKIICDTLDEDHVLRDSEGQLMKALDEGFNTAFTPMRQFCRVANLSVLERRRIFLEELHLKSFPLKETLKLPVDIEKGLLFGSEKKNEDEVTNVESIIADYSEKADEVRKLSTAFTVKVDNGANKSQKRQNTDSHQNSGKKFKPDQAKNQKKNYQDKSRGKSGKKNQSGFRPSDKTPTNKQ